MEQILTFLSQKKILWVLTFFIFLSCVFGTLYVTEVTAEESFSCPKLQTIEEEEEAKEEGLFVIDIKGAVLNPGVYRIESDKVVNDAITMAGGLLKDADTSNINLSKKVSDEMVINIFTKEEVDALEPSKEPILEEETSNTDGKINVNTATLEELISLPGIGESKAKLIIDYRTTCGKILKKEEIKNIKGIGNAIYEKLEKYITV